MTDYLTAIAGDSPATTTVHIVEDPANCRVACFPTRGGLEAMRERSGCDDYRFHVGVRVPVDSKAAISAAAHFCK